MTDVKDISICPAKDCACCALDRKIMCLIEEEAAAGRIEDNAMALVALAHVAARTAYKEIKGTGVDRAVETVSWFAKVKIKALSRLDKNDHQEPEPTKKEGHTLQ